MNRADARERLLAAVDLGSNSFRLEIGRASGHQIWPIDSLREPVRLAAGLRSDKYVDEDARQRAMSALDRFAERLRGYPTATVRAIGTNTFRVARNARSLLNEAQNRLGHPVEVISGHEEARLIYLGVASLLASGGERRLVVDIGGGSTELVIGEGRSPERLESVYVGCVGITRAHLATAWTRAAFRRAEMAVRHEIEVLSRDFRMSGWTQAIGSSGTARALADLLEANGHTDHGISLPGLYALRAAMIRAGSPERLRLDGLKEDRLPVLAGGLAIMIAVFEELGIDRMDVSAGALRTGILYDLLGRFSQEDMRESTVREFMQRYHVDASQADRVAATALQLWESTRGTHDTGSHATLFDSHDAGAKLLEWSARLHEIGRQISHNGYHKHSTYMLANADMPGFSRREQDALAMLVLGHTGKLVKMRDRLVAFDDFRIVACLRLAALLHRSRAELTLPVDALEILDDEYVLQLDRDMLRDNPLTEFDLAGEMGEWQRIGQLLRVIGR